MFDLTSFIRQLLPPHRRQPLTIALARVLFGPAQSIMSDLATKRTSLLDQVRTTGQTMVLEDLLTRMVATYSNSTVYIAEGNSVNYDFTVIVPADVPATFYGTIQAVVDRYKQAGKRYQIAKGIQYDVIDNSNDLAWVSGYPYISGNRLYWAINKLGTFYTRVTSGDQILVDQSIPYGLGSVGQIDVDPTKAYLVEVGKISATVQASAKFIDSQVGYDWNVANGRTLFVGFNASEPPTVTITTPTGSTITPRVDTFGVNFDGHNYQYRVYLPNLTSGQYLVAASVNGAPNSYSGYLILTDDNSGQGLVINGLPPATNQAPVINKQVSAQTATVGVAFSQIIPSDTFKDNDGTVASVAVTAGLPDGLTAQVTGLSIVLSGTPTLPGNYTVRVTATDDKGATTLMMYVITVSTKPIDPNPITGDYGLTVIDTPARTDVLDLAIEWVTLNGQKWARVYNRANPQPQDGRRWFFIVNGFDTAYENTFTGIYLKPGTYGQVYAGLGTQKSIFFDGYSQKAQQQFYIGNPPA